eukprot:316410-Chlamydomonas_euryale.AAC.1
MLPRRARASQPRGEPPQLPLARSDRPAGPHTPPVVRRRAEVAHVRACREAARQRRRGVTAREHVVVVAPGVKLGQRQARQQARSDAVAIDGHRKQALQARLVETKAWQCQNVKAVVNDVPGKAAGV